MKLSSTYFPFQPGFETNQDFQNFKITVTHPLYGFITDFYQFQLHDPFDSLSLDILPDACSDLFFQLNEKNSLKNSVSINGTTKSLCNVTLNTNTTFFGIRFYPGAIQRIFSLPAEELIENEIPLTDLLSDEQEFELMSIINSAKEFEERIDHVSSYFSTAINNFSSLPEIVSYSVDYIINHSGDLRVDSLAEKTGYSTRYLRKTFSQFVGLSPKEFCEIIRFQKSFNEICIAKSTLSTVASKYGYSDHAQMNKAYIKFSNQAPSKLLNYFSFSEKHK